MIRCPSGKACYRTFWSATRRLKYEELEYKNKNKSPQGYTKGGEVYKCTECNCYHITRHATKKRYKKSKSKEFDHAKRLSK